MRGHPEGRKAWSIAALALVVDVVAIGLLVTSLGERVPAVWGNLEATIVATVATLVVPLLGGLIASRRPENAIGWILLGAGAVFAVSDLSSAYALRGLVTAPGALPGASIAGWVYQWIWVLGFATVPLIILLFPDGRLLHGAWRAVPVALGGAVVLMGIVAALMWRERGLRLFLDPESVPGLVVAEPFFAGVIVLLGGAVVAAIVHLLVRFRRSRGVELEQLKWLVTFGSLWVLFILVDMVTEISSSGVWGYVLSSVMLLTIPGSIAVAILRYRLYDIDRIINRTIVYTVLTVVLGLVYVTGVVGLGGVVRRIAGGGSNSLVVAASTLTVAALFRPARARVQGLIDRRFYRRRYDAVRTVEGFTVRLRDEVALDSLTRELLTVVRSTVQPTHASVWLRGAGGGWS